MRMQAVRLGRLRMMPCRTRCNGAGTRATLGTRQQTLRESTCTCCWSRSACCNHRDAGRAHQQHQRRGVCMRGSMWIAPQSALPNDYHTCTIGSTNVRGGQRSTVCAASKGGGQKRKGSLLAGVLHALCTLCWACMVKLINLGRVDGTTKKPCLRQTAAGIQIGLLGTSVSFSE